MYKALQDSIGLNEKLSLLSDLGFRVWAYGLARADMFGRIAATPTLFRATAMPLLNVDLEDLAREILALGAAGLVHLYEVSGKRYAVYHDHDQSGCRNLRHRRPSYPPPPAVCSCIQLAEGETAVATAVPTAVPTVTVPSLSPSLSPVLDGEGIGEGVEGVFKGAGLKPVEDDGSGAMRQLMITARRVTKMPNKPDTIRSTLESVVARHGAGKVEEWLMAPENVGKDVNEMRDEMKKANGKAGGLF